jgi:dihydroorotate dehydrogenase electron transfer subunit
MKKSAPRGSIPVEGSPASGIHHSAPPRAVRISEKVTENAKTVSLVTSASISAQPGQFCMLWLPGLDEKPFSIAECDPLTFTVAHVGPFSDALHDLGAGDTLWFRGPFGKGFPLGGERAVLVGGGYGAAPLFFLARELLEARTRGHPTQSSHPDARAKTRRSHTESVDSKTADGSPIIALGAKSSADLLFRDRFASLGLETLIATEDGSMGTKGLITEIVRPLLESGRVRHLYSCGPEAMLESLAALCRAYRVSADLSYEAYMRCGVGICGACEHGERLVCMDGPVFSLPS